MNMITERQHKIIMQYQDERSKIQEEIHKQTTAYLLERIAVEYAKQIKGKECMYTRDCFLVYLNTLADTIAKEGEATAYLLPVIQRIKNRVFGC